MGHVNPRVVIVGESPGPQDSGAMPLFGGLARNRAGSRMRDIAGLTLNEWSRVRRVNLYATAPPRWDHGEARATAVAWMHSLLCGCSVVCCGMRVARAFGVHHNEPFAWHEVRHPPGTKLWVGRVPHPSGRNLAYNDPRTRCLARAFLQRAILEGDPS